MMTFEEIKDWRNRERERLPSYTNARNRQDAEQRILILNAVLGED